MRAFRRCRARGTTMRREVQAILKAQFAHRGGLLTEDCLCVRVSPEPKRQLTDYGRERRMNVADLAEVRHEPVNWSDFLGIPRG